MFDSKLPADVNIYEIDEIERVTNLSEQLLSDDWEISNSLETCLFFKKAIEY